MLSQSSTTVTPPSTIHVLYGSLSHSLILQNVACKTYHQRSRNKRSEWIVSDSSSSSSDSVAALAGLASWHSPTEQLLWVCPRDDDKLMMMRCWLVGADLLTGRRMPLKHPIQISRNNYFRRRWRIQSRYIGTPVTVSKITATNNKSIFVA